ncbi:MAG: class I SAM-dependent methyltransferase [Gammaproteobacteria bacterium]
MSHFTSCPGKSELYTLTLIPANYVTDDWIALLAENGFDFDLPTHILWEGNTMYLTYDDMKRVMMTIHERIRYASLSFDYLSTKVIDKSTGDAGLSALVEHFARLGAPWITGIDDVYALGDELGLDVIQNVLSADLHRWHWPTRPMSSSVLRFYSLCTLATKSESARLTQSRNPRAIYPQDGCRKEQERTFVCDPCMSQSAEA